MEWWFKHCGQDVFIKLGVDETSSPDEIEDEIEYWMTQLKVYGIPEGEHKSGVMAAVRWMTNLL